MKDLLEPALEELLDSSEPEEVLEVLIRITNVNDIPKDVLVISQFGDVITCRIASNKIREIKKHKSILSVRAPRPLIQDLPLKVETYQTESDLQEIVNDQFRRPREFTGKGVAVAFIDEGIDFASKAFLDKDGNTRIKAIWDQKAKYSSDRPNKYGYGRIYTREEINQSLKEKDPFYALGYDPYPCEHGTAVCEIAVGSQRISDKRQIQGIAPESDIICVRIGSQYVGGRYNLGDSCKLIESIDFVSNIAGKQPLVVNVSLGNSGGPHDPTSNVVKAIDNFVSQSSSNLVVMSCGNYKDARIHTHGIVRVAREKTFNWLIDPADETYNELEIWYCGCDTLSFGISMPGSSEVLTTQLGEKKPILVNGFKVGMIYHRKDTLNRDCVIDVFLYRKAPAGKWKIILYGKDVVDGSYHAWIERDMGNPNNQSRFDANEATVCSTIGSICNGLQSIAVGAFDSRTRDRRLAHFSSCGPTRIGTKKPNLLAPGVQIPVASCSAAKGLVPNSGFVLRSGTSFATPFVTGTVALMFQACNGKLTASEIRKILLSTAEKTLEDFRCSGDGYLNIDAAIRAVVEIVARKETKLTESKDPEESFIEYFNPTQNSGYVSPISLPENVNIAETTENILINTDSSNHYKLVNGDEDEDKFSEEQIYRYEQIDGNPSLSETAETFDYVPEDENPSLSENSNSILSDYSNLYGVQEQNQNQFYPYNRIFGNKIIEIVNNYILSKYSSLPSESLLSYVLTNVGILDRKDLWLHQYLTPTLIFDFFKYGKNRYPKLNFDDFFEIVAKPGELFLGKFDSGNMVIRRILGTKFGYLWFIVSPNLFTYEELSRNNLTVERSNRLARYVHVVESNRNRDHSIEDSFCRMVLDQYGYIPQNQMVLTLKKIPVIELPETLEIVDNNLEIDENFTESPSKGRAIARTKVSDEIGSNLLDIFWEPIGENDTPRQRDRIIRLKKIFDGFSNNQSCDILDRLQPKGDLYSNFRYRLSTTSRNMLIKILRNKCIPPIPIPTRVSPPLIYSLVFTNVKNGQNVYDTIIVRVEPELPLTLSQIKTIELYVDNKELLPSAKTSILDFIFNTTTFSNGVHTLDAVATLDNSTRKVQKTIVISVINKTSPPSPSSNTRKWQFLGEYVFETKEEKYRRILKRKYFDLLLGFRLALSCSVNATDEQFIQIKMRWVNKKYQPQFKAKSESLLSTGIKVELKDGKLQFSLYRDFKIFGDQVTLTPEIKSSFSKPVQLEAAFVPKLPLTLTISGQEFQVKVKVSAIVKFVPNWRRVVDDIIDKVGKGIKKRLIDTLIDLFGRTIIRRLILTFLVGAIIAKLFVGNDDLSDDDEEDKDDKDNAKVRAEQVQLAVTTHLLNLQSRGISISKLQQIGPINPDVDIYYEVDQYRQRFISGFTDTIMELLQPDWPSRLKRLETLDVLSFRPYVPNSMNPSLSDDNYKEKIDLARDNWEKRFNSMEEKLVMNVFHFIHGKGMQKKDYDQALRILQEQSRTSGMAAAIQQFHLTIVFYTYEFLDENNNIQKTDGNIVWNSVIELVSKDVITKDIIKSRLQTWAQELLPSLA